MKGRSGGTSTGFALLACLVVTCAWDIASRMAAEPFAPLSVTREEFTGFRPASGDWRPAEADGPAFEGTAGNLIAFTGSGAESGNILVRLVHGFNMPMCMKWKGYEVALQRDDLADSGSQIWTLVSPEAVTSIWATVMLAAPDLAVRKIDNRTMRFPRVATAQDPTWAARGLTWASLKHPVATLRAYLREAWNNARCDLLTFLRLRKGAWLRDDLLTLVVSWTGPSVTRGDAQSVAARVLDAMHCVKRDLAGWRGRRLPRPDDHADGVRTGVESPTISHE